MNPLYCGGPFSRRMKPVNSQPIGVVTMSDPTGTSPALLDFEAFPLPEEHEMKTITLPEKKAIEPMSREEVDALIEAFGL